MDPERKSAAFECADKFQQLVNNGFMQKVAYENQNLLNLMDLY